MLRAATAAIHSANRNEPVGGCTAGGGTADTIVLPGNGTQTPGSINNSTLGPGLPVITSKITISGNRGVIQ